MPSAWSQSAGYQHGKRVFNTSLNPLSLHVSAPQPLTMTIIKQHRGLDHLRLGPRRHPIEQHLLERPYMVSQASRHRRRARPPHLGRAPAVGWNGLSQRLAQAGMAQDEIVIHLEQRQVLTQPVFALPRRGAAPSNGRHPLTQAQIEPFNKRRIDLPAAGSQALLDRQLRAKHHAVVWLK